MMINNALNIRYSVTIILVFTVIATYSNYTNIDLPSDHIKYYFNSFPTVAEECRNNTACPYKVMHDILIIQLCQNLSIKGVMIPFSLFMRKHNTTIIMHESVGDANNYIKL